MDEGQKDPGAADAGDESTLARLKAARRNAEASFGAAPFSNATFGDTPIQMPEPPPDAPPTDEDEEEGSPSLEPRVRNAALAASLRTAALACVAAIFMGFVLVCSLGGLLPGGWALALGLFVMVIGLPVALVAGFSAYRQTLETERHKVGLCPRCGYDLRGSMGLRCPECGWRITTPGSTKSQLTDEEQRMQDYT